MNNQTSELISAKKFGYLFTCVSLALSFYCAYKYKLDWKFISLASFSAIIFLITISSPSFLIPVNRAWIGLGEIMGRIVSPLVLGILFFALITPVAIITRIFGRDELRLSRSDVNSYWRDRDPPSTDGESFKNQF